MRILVTAGPTREYLDAVRYLSNASSGKMGFACARAAARAGHDVTLVTGPVALPDPPGLRTIRVTSADDMYRAVMKAYPKVDAAIMTRRRVRVWNVRGSTNCVAERLMTTVTPASRWTSWETTSAAL